MNIVHVIFNMSAIGGAETLLIDIANRQAALGHKVALVMINSGNNPVLLATLCPAVKVVCAGRPQGSRNPLYALRLNLILARLRPDVIHLHAERAIGMIGPLPGVKTLLTLHTTGLNVIQPHRISQICSISQGVGDELSRRQGLGSTVVYNGIDVDAIAKRTPADCSGFGPGRPLRIVQLGRLDHPVKGQHLTLQAVRHLADLGIDSIEVTFIGGGPSLDYLKNLACELRLDSRVTFTGAKKRSETYAMLADFDLALQPSLTEGFGLTIAEAMAARVPVIAANLPGPSEVTGGGRYGRLFECGDSLRLAGAISQTIGDYVAAENMAAEALEFVRSRFDIAATAHNYLKLYSS